MNDPEPFNRKLVKSLFSRLVKDVGGQDPAAVYLGVSRQRVSDLANISNDEKARETPTWEQVWTLESVLGRSVVFGGLASRIEPAPPARTTCAVKETHDLVMAVAALCPVAQALDPSKPGTIAAFQEAFAKVQREASDLQAIAAATITPLREVG